MRDNARTADICKTTNKAKGHWTTLWTYLRNNNSNSLRPETSGAHHGTQSRHQLADRAAYTPSTKLETNEFLFGIWLATHLVKDYNSLKEPSMQRRAPKMALRHFILTEPLTKHRSGFKTKGRNKSYKFLKTYTTYTYIYIYMYTKYNNPKPWLETFCVSSWILMRRQKNLFNHKIVSA